MPKMGAASSVASRPSSATSRQDLTLIDLPVDMVILDTVSSDLPNREAEGEARTILAPRRALPPVPAITPISERDERDSNSRISIPGTAQGTRTASPAREYSNETKLRITELQQGSLKRVLTELEEHFEVLIDHELVLKEARQLELRSNAVVLEQGAQALGLCVVDTGVLQVSDAEGSTVLAHLFKWDMCGELSTLFDIPCSATVRVSPDQDVVLIYIPVEAIRSKLTNRLSKQRMRTWCIRRSYIDISGLFTNGELSLSVITTCLKSSRLFTLWNTDAIIFLARLCNLTIFGPGEYLSKLNEPASHLFAICKGSVSVSTKRGPTQRKCVKYSEEGYFVGDKDFFPKRKSAEDIRATGPLLVVPVTREALLATLFKFPSEDVRFQALLDEYISGPKHK